MRRSVVLDIMPRDLRLFTAVAIAGGIVDTVTVWNHFFANDRSGESCRRRLRCYVENQLLEPVHSGLRYRFATKGRPSTIYRLTEKAVELVNHMNGKELRHSPLRAPRTETLDHRLGLTRTYLITRDACEIQRFAEPEWIHEYTPRQRVAVSTNAKFHERFLLCHHYTEPDGTSASCWPDAACLIRIRNAEKNKEYPLIILWEYDRSTESLKQFRDSKLPGYHQLLQRGDAQRLFPHADRPTVRVFVVTQSEERRQNLAKDIHDQAASAVFRLTTAGSLTAQSFFKEPIWFNVNGEALAIL